ELRADAEFVMRLLNDGNPWPCQQDPQERVSREWCEQCGHDDLDLQLFFVLQYLRSTLDSRQHAAEADKRDIRLLGSGAQCGEQRSPGIAGLRLDGFVAARILRLTVEQFVLEEHGRVWPPAHCIYQGLTDVVAVAWEKHGQTRHGTKHVLRALTMGR